MVMSKSPLALSKHAGNACLCATQLLGSRFYERVKRAEKFKLLTLPSSVKWSRFTIAGEVSRDLQLWVVIPVSQ